MPAGWLVVLKRDTAVIQDVQWCRLALRVTAFCYSSTR